MEGFNLPFIAYVEGSYFGDSDIFFQDDSNGRDGTAMADSEVHLLVLGKKDLNAIMEEFEEMAKEMKQIAQERKANHEKLILSIVNEYKRVITDHETSPAAHAHKDSPVPRVTVVPPSPNGEEYKVEDTQSPEGEKEQMSFLKPIPI